MLGYNKLTTRHRYLKEDCGRNDPSMSPGSRSGRGAMTLTPAPNGAKEFYIARRTSKLIKGKNPSSARGDRTQCLSSEEPAFNPSAKGRLKTRFSRFLVVFFYLVQKVVSLGVLGTALFCDYNMLIISQEMDV